MEISKVPSAESVPKLNQDLKLNDSVPKMSPGGNSGDGNQLKQIVGLELLNMVSQQLQPSPTQETIHRTPDRVIVHEENNTVSDASIIAPEVSAIAEGAKLTKVGTFTQLHASTMSIEQIEQIPEEKNEDDDGEEEN